MDWTEIVVHTNSKGSEVVSGLLMELGATGTMIEDRADIPDPSKPHGIWEIIDPKLLENMPEDVLVHAWFEPDSWSGTISGSLKYELENLKHSSPDLGSLVLDTREAKDEDWSETWKQYYKPFSISEKLVVKPSWEEYTPQGDEQIIHLDPGMAFGSGTHETTGMCVSLMEQNIRGGETVLDIGTGSGILAIAAALLGAGSVLAVDIDPDAVRVAKENVERNGVSAVVDVRQGDLLANVDSGCDICVANIISDIIIRYAGAFFSHVRKGGLFICSGIVNVREKEVEAALTGAGFVIHRTEHRGEWTAFLSGRPD